MRGVKILFFRRVGCELASKLACVLASALALSAALSTSALAGEKVVCQYTYGGETHALEALPVSSPYGVKAIDIGSFFHLRVVFQDRPAAHASIKVYTYADRDDGPLLIHLAQFAYPPAAPRGAAWGFSGLQSVHEPVRDGELQYWCRLQPLAGTPGKGTR